MLIQEVQKRDKEQYNALVVHPVQSWEWGEFRQKTGNKIIRLGIYKNGKLQEACLLTLHQIPYTNCFAAMLAKGPAPTRQMLKALYQWAEKANAVFVRLEPNVALSELNANKLISLFKQFKMQKGKPFFNKSTYLVDLTKTEEQILQGMHPKTRYNIRLSQRHGLQVMEDNSEEAFKRYLDLMDETTKRQNYYAHTARYHRLMWEVLYPSGIAHLFKAVYQDKTLVTWILFVWKDTLYYPYGASSQEHKNVMAPYALMWEAIRFGKKLGLATFDLWGSDDKKGYTKFKEGFNTKNVEFVGTWDMPVDRNFYYLYIIAEELRWKFLKLKAHFTPLSSFK